MGTYEFSDRHPYIVFILVCIVSFLFVVSSLVEQNKELKEQNKKFYELISEQRDDLGCLKTVSGDGLDHQCRTEALLRIQIQETKKLTNNLYGI